MTAPGAVHAVLGPLPGKVRVIATTGAARGCNNPTLSRLMSVWRAAARNRCQAGLERVGSPRGVVRVIATTGAACGCNNPTLSRLMSVWRATARNRCKAGLRRGHRAPRHVVRFVTVH